ncbi:Hypothetical_protein [Hexamita inflata]|uniref:Hypothetical_protein n=1 Tax=Hexamita inflata TaxID=28002 RepID=A0AA86UU56_9EUKA|nr:Hypothetical protein HINF_LOCUS59535 [Hexamita inflata]
MLCMKAPSRRSKVKETVKLPEEGHRERRQASRVWEQGKKAKPKATLDRTGSGQPSTIEDLEHERVRKQYLVIFGKRGMLLVSQQELARALGMFMSFCYKYIIYYVQ